MDFDMLGLSPTITTRLSEMGITEPTPIQARAIPEVMQGRDVLGLAQTGTGKTAAFGLPLIQGLTEAKGKPMPKTVRSLILAPTRELVNQISDNLRHFAGGSKISVATVVGGVSINRQIGRLARGADILVATPGRLIDLLERDALTLREARYLVLDEADQMLDMGFIHALRKILPQLPKDRQTLLFSATMPKLMNEIAASYLDRPVRVEVAPPGKPADKVAQEVRFVAKEEKLETLIALLDGHKSERAMVFARTKHGAERLSKQLARAGFAAAAIHGNKSQNQRDRALNAFREGELTVLVATDVAARGIDIPEVGYVYNFEMPHPAESYVHRIGRTARAGREGLAIALCGPEEMEELRAIEKILKKDIPVAAGRPWPETRKPAPVKRRGRPQQNRRRGGGGNRKAA